MTTKQATAIKEIVDTRGNATAAMRKAGYAEKTIKNPKNLTESKAFKEVMEAQGISDERLANILSEGLDATTKKPHLVDRDDKGRPIYEYVKEDDFLTRHKYLETSLRLKGHERQIAPNTVIIPIYGGLSGRPEDVPLPGYDSDSQNIQAQATH